MKSPFKILLINPGDNVAVALTTIPAGEKLDTGKGIIMAREDIPYGFKIALSDIEKGESIIKYGEAIGLASRLIIAGDQVHIHNCESQRGRGDLIKKA